MSYKMPIYYSFTICYAPAPLVTVVNLNCLYYSYCDKHNIQNIKFKYNKSFDFSTKLFFFWCVLKFLRYFL